ncbi:hypothetical protein, partial [Solihabitans fulvus]|uniref:hypothetical protein n=1 Tax=Solihabitans fulvus TaxID=1892852 RepID=UPI001CB75DC1
MPLERVEHAHQGRAAVDHLDAGLAQQPHRLLPHDAHDVFDDAQLEPKRADLEEHRQAFREMGSTRRKHGLTVHYS